jgi:riboflavin synthase
VFTGIVQGLRPVVYIRDEPSLRRILIDLGDLSSGLLTGASVAVNGVCLTVTTLEDGGASFDVIQESLDRTNLGELRVGDRVNVERSFRVGDEVGGHLLSGHVSDVAVLARIDAAPNVRNLTFRVPADLIRYLHHKGFVALDGASLTIAAVDGDAATIGVALIPETIGRTTLGTIEPGARVNLEIDAKTQAIVATVERVLAARTSD